jgi:hypothetical protein
LHSIIHEALLQVLEHGPENYAFRLVLLSDDLMQAFLPEGLNDDFTASHFKGLVAL